VEFVLGVKSRAQQIIAPCIKDRVGANGLADRTALIAHLRKLAGGEGPDTPSSRESERHQKFAHALDKMRQDRLEKPQLLVEAPTAVVNQELANLPLGVTLEPGSITVTFTGAQDALEKLLALAMAISNDFEQFERLVEVLECRDSYPAHGK
jgi:hypothetical protein